MSDPVRVLFVNENIGGHVTVHNAIRRCVQERTDVVAEFLDAQDPHLAGKLLRAPLPGLARLDLDLQPLRAQLVRSRGVRRALAARLARGDVDVVHVYTQNCALTSARLLRQLPCVVTTDSTTALNAYRIPYRTPTRFTRLTVRASVPAERRVLDAADHVIANSAEAADSLRQVYGVREPRLEVLPFGVWLPPEPAERPERRPTLVFVGHNLERKGGNRLLRLHQQHLRDRCDLVLVTTQPVQPAPGVRVVADLAGGDDRLWEVLAGADVMVFPSTIDQAPNAVLEAAAAGLPVIAHPVAAVGEMVRDGVTGLLVPPEDDTALLAAITSLLDDPARRREMGRQGRRHVEQHYDMRVAVDRLLAICRDLAAAPRAGRGHPA
ncbi:glycosyltransferase family 4 protein [Rhodococcus sp. X156]|uniref:glycosyltransferase family 4 protein n=1 Tax=Rhodococcus sp. X156 TaxID=2499145 RepID=UPI000FD73427|nr:glycosyltransferase family 4 protein [Rhodococcus sp. X156]